MRLMMILLAVAMLSGCISQQSKPFVGKSYSELRFEWGAPIADVTDDGGQRIVQYMRDRGGMRYRVPNGRLVASTSSCLVTFVMRPRGTDWIITEAIWPVRLGC